MKPLVMSTEDGELNGQPVPQLKVSGSNRQIGTLRLDAVVVEVDNCETRRRAKDEDGIVREGKKTLADLKADAPGRTAAFQEGVAAAEEGVNDCPYGFETDEHSDWQHWQHGHRACRAVLVQIGRDFLEYRYPPSAPIPMNREALSDLARVLIREGSYE